MEKQTEQSTKRTVFILPKRELTWALAFTFLISFLMFCAGYFWGKRTVVQQLLHKVKDESFADSITYSLYSLTSQENDEAQDADNNDLQIQEEQKEEVVKSDNLLSEQEKTVSEQKDADITIQEESYVYAAALAGFGTYKAAQKLADSLLAVGIPVVVKKRSSSTHSRKTIVWYQVVTGDYVTEADLKNDIALIEKKEHIKGITVVKKKKG